MRAEIFDELKSDLLEGNRPHDVIVKLHELIRIGKGRLNDDLKRQLQAEQDAKFALLKSLKAHSIVYCRNTGDLFGERLMKIKDGRTFMLVAGKGKQWRVPYSMLQVEPLDEVTLNLGSILRDRW